jgi:hypothetical protein
MLSEVRIFVWVTRRVNRAKFRSAFLATRALEGRNKIAQHVSAGIRGTLWKSPSRATHRGEGPPLTRLFRLYCADDLRQLLQGLLRWWGCEDAG